MENLDFIQYFQKIAISDIIDILIVAFLIYKIISLLRGTSAERLVKGIVVIIIAMQVAKIAHLNTISYLIDSSLTLGLTALLIIFQPELRRILEQIGKGKMVSGLLPSREDGQSELEAAIVQVRKACEAMSRERIGALIVFERVEKLSEIVGNGTHIDAETSSELVRNIFYPKSPLHDGAMIEREGRVLAAGCVLPLSGNQSLSRDLGTRHRAAVGMSETSDSVLVVVSEETGAISVAIGGMLKRHLTPETLEKILRAELMPADNDTKKKAHRIDRIVRRKRKGKAE